MGSKNQPAEFDCYANALPDEPMFILLGRDTSAPDLVNDWADCRAEEIAAGKRPPSDLAMVDEARVCATNMRLWRRRNDGAWRKPKDAA